MRRLSVATQQTFLQVSSRNIITFVDKDDVTSFHLIMFNFARRHVRQTNYNILRGHL